jgi:hypothetical protein
VALVLTDADLRGRADDASAAALREQAQRALALVRRGGAPKSDLLARLAQSPPVGSAIPWLQLAPDEVLIVPRLGPAGQADRVVREVDGELAKYGLEARWLRRPASPFR